MDRGLRGFAICVATRGLEHLYPSAPSFKRNTRPYRAYIPSCRALVAPIRRGVGVSQMPARVLAAHFECGFARAVRDAAQTVMKRGSCAPRVSLSDHQRRSEFISFAARNAAHGEKRIARSKAPINHGHAGGGSGKGTDNSSHWERPEAGGRTRGFNCSNLSVRSRA